MNVYPKGWLPVSPRKRPIANLSGVLLPYTKGVHRSLEAMADQIIVQCSRVGTITPFKDHNLLHRSKIDGGHVHHRMVFYGLVPERTGIYIREFNWGMPWLNSQPLNLGGRRDLIRRTGEHPTRREEYEDWGTFQTGRWDPWMAFMVMTPGRPDMREHNHRARKLRAGAYTEAPWRLTSGNS